MGALMYGSVSAGGFFTGLAKLLDNISTREGLLESELLKGANYIAATSFMEKSSPEGLMIGEAFMYGFGSGFTAVACAFYLLKSVKKD